MDVNSAEYLINALLDAGVWTADQAEKARAAVSVVKGDPIKLAECFKSSGPLTGYQLRKIRHGRIIDLTVGSFVVLEKIGEGGMGKVYKAISPKIGKPVALKVVRSHLMTNKTVLRRYKREAAAAAALDHPNIVTLLDADEVGGRCYLAMEYVEGSDLSRLVKEHGALPFQEAAEYIRQASLGLQHAHERGLIHRDIKPSNLLVSGERALPGTDGKAHVRILDMGLVRSIMGDDDVSQTELTRDGTVVGTPDYMAPEQAKNSSKVDAKADLYALGATLFYLLRAQAPFPDGSPIDKLLRHQLDPPPNLRKLRPDLPLGLVAIIDKLLKKRPEERYANAAELAIVLQPYSSGADAGLAFAPVANTGGDADVSLDLPEGSSKQTVHILDAEIVAADELPAFTLPPRVVRAVPKPVKKAPPKRIVRPAPGPSNDPNSGSMPGPDQITKQGGTTTTRTPASSARGYSERTPPRAVYRKPEQNPNRKILGVAFAAAGALVLLSGAILLLSGTGRKPTTKATTSDAPPTTPSTAPSISPPTHRSVVLARPDLVIADNAVAILTVSPQQYWKRTVYDQSTRPHQANWLKWLTANYAFDTRLLDRVTVSFLPRQETIAVGEGGGITVGWIEKLRKTFAIDESSTGWRTVSVISHFGGNQREKLVGLLLGDEAIAIGSDRQSMQLFGRRYSKNKSPEGVDKTLLDELPKSDEANPPFVAFVAGKQWRLPDADKKPLMDYGVSKLVAKVRLVGEEYEVELQIWGESEKRLKDEFLSLGLATHLTEKYPAIKPFQAEITTATPEASRDGTTAKLRIVAKWPFADFHDWLELLLGDPPGTNP